jgi:hypothetical protein
MKATLQDIFNAAWNHFIVGDGKPALEGGHCMYLTPNGRKCAIGLVIPDGHPAQAYLRTVAYVAREWPELLGADFLALKDHDQNNFQSRLHDALCLENRDIGGFRQPDGWLFTKEERREKYIMVAKDYGLSVPD